MNDAEKFPGTGNVDPPDGRVNSTLRQGTLEPAKELDHFVYTYIYVTGRLYSVGGDVSPTRVSKPISFELTEKPQRNGALNPPS